MQNRPSINHEMLFIIINMRDKKIKMQIRKKNTTHYKL